MTVSDRAVAIWIAVIAAAIYVAAGIGLATDYDYYGRLADAFLHGRWWLTEAPPWLNELLPCGDGRFCVVYPPLPAILSLPFVPFFPTAVSQVVASRIAGGASAGILYYGLRAYGAPRTYALAGAVLSAFGTTLLFSSVDGRAWFAAHSASMLFLALAFAVAARGGSAFAVAALLALLPDLFHATWGFQQFGYRFSIDAQPFLVALGLTGDGLFRGAWRHRPTVIFILAIVLSLAVNIYATIAITRFEYWQ